MILSDKGITKVLIRLFGLAGLSAPLMFANPGRQVCSRGNPYYALCHFKWELYFVISGIRDIGMNAVWLRMRSC